MMLKMEGTFGVLPLVAVTTLLSLFAFAQESTDNAGITTITTTITSTITVTQAALTRVAAESASIPTLITASHDMKSEGKEYVLQGCYAQSGNEDMGTLLGRNYMVPEADDMSLSFCLKTCASAVVPGTDGTYPFVGVASGK